jgi:hypothetical protein
VGVGGNAAGTLVEHHHRQPTPSDGQNPDSMS